MREVGPFGELLRAWRKRRGLSQLELSGRADTTPRHLSFVETGRSRPGRELALRIAVALDLPQREQNALLAAAGLPPAYPTRPLDHATMGAVTSVVDLVLQRHEPFPAWLYTRGLRALRANAAAEALFPGLCGLSGVAVVDLWFSEAFRAAVENWEEVVRAGIDSLRREVARSADAEAVALLAHAEAQAEGVRAPTSCSDDDPPTVCPRFLVGGQSIRTVSTVLRFETAREVTSSELRVELMFPADAASEAFFRALAPSA